MDRMHHGAALRQGCLVTPQVRVRVGLQRMIHIQFLRHMSDSRCRMMASAIHPQLTGHNLYKATGYIEMGLDLDRIGCWHVCDVIFC